MWVRDHNGRYYDNTSLMSKACASFAHVSFQGSEARQRRERAQAEWDALPRWRKRFTKRPVAEQAEIDGLAMTRDVLQALLDSSREGAK